MIGVILYSKLLKVLWGNCMPQESLETQDVKWVSELWLGCLITRLLFVEHLNVWDFSPSDPRFLGTFLFCLYFERIKISSVEITVRYSVWSWERWWRTEANAYLYLLVIIRNTTDLSVIKQASQRQNVLKSRKDVLWVGRFRISHVLWRFLHHHTCPFSPPEILFPVILVFITKDNIRY